MIKKLLVAITSISLLATGPAMAIGYGTATVYSGVTWSFSSSVPGLLGCSRLYMDASGDFQNSSGFVLCGSVDCPSLGGGYAAVGNGYFGTGGGFNMTINSTTGSQIVCGGLNGSTLSGVCSVYNSTGSLLGTVRLTLV